MNLLLEVALKILLLFGIAYIVGLTLSYIVYYFRKNTIQSKDEMVSFLDERYDTIRTRGIFPSKQDHEYIDVKLIKSWGRNGWTFIGMSAISINLPPDSIIGVSNFLAFTYIVGDSRSASFFLKQMKLTKYKPMKLPNKT